MTKRKKRRSYRLACFDVDGTLMDSNHEIPESALSAIAKLKETGCRIALASGRAPVAAKLVAEMIGVDAPCSLYAGSFVGTPDLAEIIHECLIEKEVVLDSLEAISDLGIYTELYTEDDIFIEKRQTLSDIHELYLKVPIKEASLTEIATQRKIYKILFALDEDQADLQPVVEERLAGLNFGCGTAAGHPEIVFMNVTSPEATREKAFKALIDHFSISADEVITFGDAHSDIEFITLAGTGVAMGNAPEDVKDAANHVTGHVDQNGLGNAIENLIDII